MLDLFIAQPNSSPCFQEGGETRSKARIGGEVSRRVSKQIAIDAAIRLAKLDFAVGRPTRVLLDNDDGNHRVLYDSKH